MVEQEQSSPYAYRSFGTNESTDPKIVTLFGNLTRLNPMDKGGPMSGRCGSETQQMEYFLQKTFGFKNILGEYIVPGVKSFQLDRPPDQSMSLDTVIHFPSDMNKTFSMTVQEINKWQHSYKVYADMNVKEMNPEFLLQALQGHSGDGEEAFRMKFVVRISTCPILMEFDAKVISRNVDESWPNNIKLVSVTGIDFAGRKHDVGDILYYISNWREVFEGDPKLDRPVVYNGRDFYPKSNGQQARLRENRLRDSLMRMVRLRLQACDREGVQIVVETGIGLGVFSGNHIGIDGRVRAASAEAIRTVLEEDGTTYKNICAVILALPIFNVNKSKHGVPDTFDDFVHAFDRETYTGSIPVLIADQDMHRLTVAIARQGFIVSELNPADSHGVFGEYWQNRGPAVEEKLALTTVGLLVQHHLINPQVLKSESYCFLDVSKSDSLDWATTTTEDMDDKKTNQGCCTGQ